MGTEQQQEFKSEKPLTKQQRKTIPFTDNSIENWKPKKPRKRIGFSKRFCDFERFRKTNYKWFVPIKSWRVTQIHLYLS